MEILGRILDELSCGQASTYGQTDGRTDGQAGRQAGRQTDRQTDRQTEASTIPFGKICRGVKTTRKNVAPAD